MERELSEGRHESYSETSPHVPHSEEATTTPHCRKQLLSPAEQILAGTATSAHPPQPTYPFALSEGENVLAAHGYHLLNHGDGGTLSRSMTALALSSTIPEEPADMDLDSAPLMNARRVASKSAIDLVGMNEEEMRLEAGGALTGGAGDLSFGMGDSRTNASMTDSGFSFDVTMMPSRSIMVSNLNPLITDDNLQLLFQMSGDVQLMRTEYRLQGIVQVVYFDIRSGVAAREQLNGMTFAEQFLNVQFVTSPSSVGSFTEGTLLVFNIDPQLDAQQVAAHFSVYGDVKRVHSIPAKETYRLVEYFDVRHANAAMEALNKSETTQRSVNTPGLSPTGMKQTMSLQQLARGSVDSEQQEEDQSSRSWDGSAQAIHQMESLMGLNEPTTPSRYVQSGTAVGGMTRSTSFGSGLGDLKGVSDATGQDTPTSQRSGAVRLTAELAEGLRISDSASSLGSIMFPGQGNTTGLNLSPKMQYGTSTLFGGINQGGLSSSASVERGLDTYGHRGLGHQVSDAGLPQFSAQQTSAQFQHGLGMGMGVGGVNLGQGFNTSRFPMDATAVLGQPGGADLLQTIAAAQAAGLNIYDILARIPNASQGTIAQLLAASRGGLGQPAATNNSLLGNLTSANAARLATMQNLQTVPPFGSSGGISSPSYGMGGGTVSSALDLGSMSKSASSPALHVGTEDRDSTGHRFGGRLSRRNVDPVIEAERRAQQQRLYALDLDKIRRKEDKRTTLMIKNIPNKYTQKMLLASIDETLRGTYDFFYLPIDFKNKCNVGYGFINMRDPENIIPLVERFHNKKWERFNSEKVCCVAYGRIQGKNALINHFQNSSLMHEDKKHRPVLFVTDGPHKGEPEPFPIGSNIRPKITLKERDFRSRERSGHWS